MKYSECLETVELILESGHVPLIVGQSGIGKTSMIKNIAKRNNYYDINIDANLLKEGEIGGLPIVENTITRYAVFHKLAQIDDIISKDRNAVVLLFIDELNRCDHSVNQELMNLILNREINGYTLSERVKVIAAMNPYTDYEVVQMDPAQENRFVWVNLESDTKEWINWAMSGGAIHEHIIEFISSFPQYLDFKKSEDGVRATPRSWERVSKSYNVYLKNKHRYKLDTLFNVVRGNVGDDITADFMVFIKNIKNPLINVNDIFGNDIIIDELKERVLKESNSRLYISIKNAIKYVRENDSDRNLNLFSEFIDLYPRDIKLGIMKEIKKNYSDVYSKLLYNDYFIEAFFNIYRR